MSNKSQNWAWEQRGLKPPVKLVLVKIADLCNEYGQCWPSHDHLAEMCEISVRSVVTHIAVLEDRGLVEVTRRTTDEGYRTSNLYTLPPEAREIGTATSASRPALALVSGNDSGTARPALRALDGGAYVQTKVQTVALTGEPSVVNPFPPTPAQRGSRILPFDKVQTALAGQTLATESTRVCRAHRRQRRSCIDCWRVRPLSIDEVPWCGDRNCDQDIRQRLVERDGLEVLTRCPECHPLAITPERVAELLAARS